MKSILLAVCASLALSGGTALAAPILWSSADGGNDHYYEYVSGPVSWTTAFAAADAATLSGYDSYLVTVTSEAENTFLLNYVRLNTTLSNRRTWLGGTDQA